MFNGARLLRFRHETIAHSAHGEEVNRVHGIRFEISPKTYEKVVDGACICVLMNTPHVLEQLLPRNNLAGMLQQVAEQVGLHHRKVNRVTGAANLERVEVDRTIPECEG